MLFYHLALSKFRRRRPAKLGLACRKAYVTLLCPHCRRNMHACMHACRPVEQNAPAASHKRSCDSYGCNTLHIEGPLAPSATRFGGSETFDTRHARQRAIYTLPNEPTYITVNGAAHALRCLPWLRSSNTKAQRERGHLLLQRRRSDLRTTNTAVPPPIARGCSSKPATKHAEALRLVTAPPQATQRRGCSVH